MLKLVERHLHWLPYLTVALVVAAETRLSADVREHGLAAALGDRGLVLALIALALLVPQVILCSRRPSRVKATASLVAAGLLTLVLLTGLELLLPPVHQYPASRLVLQAQLDRRATRTVQDYRGYELVTDANGLGWIDRDRDLDADRRRVVLIGDSFLEWMSTRPLAARVEARLAEAGVDVEVVNLAKADTDPQHDYRLRLHELAPDYRPEHVFVFLYAGNDLNRSYRYTAYAPPSVRITGEAIDLLAGAGLPAAALDALRAAADEGTLPGTRAALDAVLGATCSAEQRQLAYLAVLAYSRPVGPGLCRRLWPATMHRIGIARDKISDAMKRARRSVGNRAEGCARRPWDELHEQYEAVVDLPVEERLAALAEVIATQYCGGEDSGPYLDALAALPEELRARLIEERSPGLLLDGLPRVVAGTTIEAETDQAEADRTAAEYHRLMQEFAEAARGMGAGLTVVLIPVAGYGDAGYRQFWAPLVDTEARYLQRRLIHETTRKELEADLDVIDLLDFADRLADGYWKFDGHWNERGNDAVAEIVTAHVLERETAAP